MNFDELDAQGFDMSQLNQIMKAKEKGIDVSLLGPSTKVDILRKINQLKYTDFDAKRILLIAKAYTRNFDVSEIVSPKFNNKQAEEIYDGQSHGLNYKIYAKEHITGGQMKQFKRGLIAGIDEDILSMSITSKANIKQCVDLIAETKAAGFDCIPYIREGYTLPKIKVLFSSYFKHLGVENYAKPWMTTHQLEAAVECELKNSRLPKENKIDVSKLITRDTTKIMISALFDIAKAGHNVNEIISKKYDKSQLNVVKLGIEQKLDYKIYWDPKFSAAQMNQLHSGLVAKVDVSMIANEKFTEAQMKLLIDLLKFNKGNPDKQIDIALVAHPEYNYNKMSQYIAKLKRGTLEEQLAIMSEHNDLIKTNTKEVKEHEQEK